jgi:cardiolipin synthase
VSINIPNFFTILRILSIPLFIILLSYDYYQEALIVFVFAALTDSLDGFFARVFKQKTALGSYLDPIADKLLLASSFVTLSMVQLIPLWLSVLVLSRDIIISLGILVFWVNSFQIEIRPTLISKCTTLFQILTIGFVLTFHVFQQNFFALTPMYWATGTLTIASGGHYISRGLKVISEKEKG